MNRDKGLAVYLLMVGALILVTILGALSGCTTVHTEDAVTVDHPTVYVVVHPDAAALVCWLDEPLSRCTSAREEDAR